MIITYNIADEEYEFYINESQVNKIFVLVDNKIFAAVDSNNNCFFRRNDVLTKVGAFTLVDSYYQFDYVDIEKSYIVVASTGNVNLFKAFMKIFKIEIKKSFESDASFYTEIYYNNSYYVIPYNKLYEFKHWMQGCKKPTPGSIIPIWAKKIKETETLIFKNYEIV